VRDTPAIERSERELHAQNWSSARGAAVRRSSGRRHPGRRCRSQIVKGERVENFMRKDFTPSEAVAIQDAVEPIVQGIKAG
jgi:hypothetical protein